MKTKELKTKSKEEARTILREQKEKLTQLRFQASSGKLRNVREIREVRKTIAKLLTLFMK